jgi:DHA2 family methylenomycin A resistance protein-like MFS transporter
VTNDATHRSLKGLTPTLVATSLGFVLVQLDVSIVNVGLARIGADLGLGVAGLEWIVDAYTLAFAALMLSAGALADRVGARRAFIAGFALFTAASLGCGIAPDAATLIVARTLQGVGAAGLVPSSLALLNHACRGDHETRAHAVGLWTAAGSVAMAAAPVVGGLMIDCVGWRSIFLVNVPIGLIGIFLTARHVGEADRGAGALDPFGQMAGIVALSAATAAVIEGGSPGSPARLALGLAVTAVLAGAAFLMIETRVAQPMLPLGFFRLPGFSAATSVGFVVNLTLYGAIFVFNIFLQRLADYSPSASGLAFLPFPVALLAANLWAGPIVARLGSRIPMTAGLLVAALGFAMLTGVKPSTPWLAMVPGLIVIPAGIGTAVPAMTTALLGCVDRARAGIASGVLNTVRQTGGAIGVAWFGSLLARGGASGLHFAFLVAPALLVAASLVALLGVRGKSARAVPSLSGAYAPRRLSAPHRGA